MSVRNKIKSILVLALWIVLATSVLGLLVAAINKKNHKTCTGVQIKIIGVKEYFFLDKNDIMTIIIRSGVRDPKGKAIMDVNLHHLEVSLKKNLCISDAELFFDNNLLLHVNVVEREPVARIFSMNGSSFYIDSSGYRMPLSSKLTLKLPVFTGFPTGRTRLTRNDSILLQDIKRISQHIISDKFWMAQIAQIDITPLNTFEMVPTVGNHIIEFGDGDHSTDKFRRLFLFYIQVLRNAGFDKYRRVSVEYQGQVIGKKETIAKIDSIKAGQNIMKMIEEARRLAQDSVFTAVDKNAPVIKKADSTLTILLKNDSSIRLKLKNNNRI